MVALQQMLLYNNSGLSSSKIPQTHFNTIFSLQNEVDKQVETQERCFDVQVYSMASKVVDGGDQVETRVSLFLTTTEFWLLKVYIFSEIKSRNKPLKDK